MKLNIPCKDCIVFPMCKSRFIIPHNKGKGLRMGILDNCSLLLSIDISIDNRTKFVEFMESIQNQFGCDFILEYASKTRIWDTDKYLKHG